MLKVTDDKVTKAYTDFLRELEVLGLKPQTQHTLDLVMLGFKKGFVEGYNEVEELSNSRVLDLTNVEVSGSYIVPSFEEQLQMNLEPKKFYPNGKNNRNQNKATNDCFYLCEYLRGSYSDVEEASTNKQIIEFMHSIGRTHWNSSNCTSFINYAINSEYPIVKVGRGLWKYQK